MSPWAINYPNTNPAGYLQQVAVQFDCPTDDSQAMVDCLKTVDAETLDAATFECTVRQKGVAGLAHCMTIELHSVL